MAEGKVKEAIITDITAGSQGDQEMREETVDVNDLPMESKVMIQLHRDQNEVLQTHMARQNVLMDKIIMQIGITNVALELMLNKVQKMVYQGSVQHILREHQSKVQKIKEQIEAARAQRSDP